MKISENNFGVRLASLRTQKDITQKQAAEDLGISAAQLSHYEKGIRECSLSFVLKLAQYYDVSCDYLLGKEDNLNRVSLDRKLYTNEAENAIYSIASYLREAFRNKEMTKSEDRVLQIIAMSLYRTILFSAQNGCIPKDWVDTQRYDNAVCLKAVDGIIDMMLSQKLRGRTTVSEDDAPESIKQIINFAENYIKDDVKILASIII